MEEAVAIALRVLAWCWHHKAWALCIILGAALLWSRHELSTVTIERDAAQSQIDAAEKSQKLAEGDVVRWETAANQNLQVIRRQHDQLTRLESDGASARAIADQKQASDRQKIDQLQAQLSTWKEKAREHPDQVRDLGSIVRDALPSLRH
jgi:hypothetical protein